MSFSCITHAHKNNKLINTGKNAIASRYSISMKAGAMLKWNAFIASYNAIIENEGSTMHG